jgi:hypothetical protein
MTVRTTLVVFALWIGAALSAAAGPASDAERDMIVLKLRMAQLALVTASIPNAIQSCNEVQAMADGADPDAFLAGLVELCNAYVEWARAFDANPTACSGLARAEAYFVLAVAADAERTEPLLSETRDKRARCP